MNAINDTEGCSELLEVLCNTGEGRPKGICRIALGSESHIMLPESKTTWMQLTLNVDTSGTVQVFDGTQQVGYGSGMQLPSEFRLVVSSQN